MGSRLAPGRPYWSLCLIFRFWYSCHCRFSSAWWSSCRTYCWRCFSLSVCSAFPWCSVLLLPFHLPGKKLKFRIFILSSLVFLAFNFSFFRNPTASFWAWSQMLCLLFFLMCVFLSLDRDRPKHGNPLLLQFLLLLCPFSLSLSHILCKSALLPQRYSV